MIIGKKKNVKKLFHLRFTTPKIPYDDGSPPYPICCYALLCALYDACSQSVSDAM